MGAEWKEWGTVGAEYLWRSLVWKESERFCKDATFELGFDRRIGVYQVVNGRSGIPGTRKGMYVQAREMAKNREQ